MSAVPQSCANNDLRDVDFTGISDLQGTLRGYVVDGSETNIRHSVLPSGADSPVNVPSQVIVPKIKSLTGSFKLLQMWVGKVVSIDEEGQDFVAIIKDKTNPKFSDEEVTLSVDEVPRGDLRLLEVGSVFYWSIGYADDLGRPRTRESRIRFRRLPGWTIHELEKGKQCGVELAELFARD